jgi:hypothetical protein
VLATTVPLAWATLQRARSDVGMQHPETQRLLQLFSYCMTQLLLIQVEKLFFSDR